MKPVRDYVTASERHWRMHGRRWVGVAIFLSVIASIWRLTNEIPLLYAGTESSSGYDLAIYVRFVKAWFSGEAVYIGGPHVKYPPASYSIFWPLLGWSTMETARTVWVWVCLLSMLGIALVGWFQTEQAANGLRGLIAALPFASYASAATIRVGQVSLLVIFILMASISILVRERSSPYRRVLAGLLLALALVKPTLALPVALVVVLLPGGAVSATTCCIVYLLLTLVASMFQEGSALSLLLKWLDESSRWGNFNEGHSNLYRTFALLGMSGWTFPTTALIFAGFGGWTIAHRNASVWTLAAVATLLARLVFYHRLYDDVLIYPVMIALLRLATEEGSSQLRTGAGLLFFFNWAALLSPGSLLNEPGPLQPVAEGMIALVWTATLVFMVLSLRAPVKSSNASVRIAEAGSP